MKAKPSKIRQWFVVALSLLVFGVFISQLLQIQIVDAPYYREVIDGQTVSSQVRKAVRGEIMDKNGKPLVVNEMAYAVVIDKAYLPTGKETNEVVLKLINIFERLDESWITNLPITKSQPYSFLEGYESEIEQLKEFVDVKPYATANDVMFHLVKRYKLEDYSSLDAYKIISVRYEMERRDFSIRNPYTFSNSISIDSVIYIKEHSFELPGVVPEAKGMRKYVEDDVVPHILGSVGPLYKEDYDRLKKDNKIFNSSSSIFDAKGYTMDDTLGKAGIEYALEDILRGSNGKREIVTDSSGSVVEAVDKVLPVPGNTVYLTIDSEMQQNAQEYLEAQIEYLRTSPNAPPEAKNTDAGAVTAIEIKTGRLLVAATAPTYNLTDYNSNYTEVMNREGSPLIDRSIKGLYTPGSIYKPVTALTALDSGIATRSSVFNCTGTYHFFEGYSPKCLSTHGNINVINALSLSCNIYFYEAGRLQGIEPHDKTAKGLGLGEPTGIEIEESIGHRSNPKSKEAGPGGDWYGADMIQTAIGQFENLYSPLQLANYAATIGNRGTRMKVSIVEEVRDFSGENVIQPFTPEIAYQMDISPESFDIVTDGMVAASRTGSARGTFANHQMNVASKTGTPQVTEEDVNSTFICFAPAEDPQIAVAVVLEKGWHGYTGASIAKAVIDDYFGLDSVVTPVANGPDKVRAQKRLEAAAKNNGEEPESSSQPTGAYTPSIINPDNQPTHESQQEPSSEVGNGSTESSATSNKESLSESKKPKKESSTTPRDKESGVDIAPPIVPKDPKESKKSSDKGDKDKDGVDL